MNESGVIRFYKKPVCGTFQKALTFLRRLLSLGLGAE